MLTLDEGGFYRGQYMILGGLLAPLERMDSESLDLDRLVNRLAEGEVQELILALGATLEAENTASFIRRLVRKRFPQIRLSRLPRAFRWARKSNTWTRKPCASPCNTGRTCKGFALARPQCRAVFLPESVLSGSVPPHREQVTVLLTSACTSGLDVLKRKIKDAAAWAGHMEEPGGQPECDN